MTKLHLLQILTLAAMAVCTASCGSQSVCDRWSGEEKAIINGEGDILRVLTKFDRADSLVLRSVCDSLSPALISSPEYELLARKMVATVTSPEQDGVGIAGPQVGIRRRVVAVMRFDKPGAPFEVYPNARITEFRGEKVSGSEGCLSVPGCRGEVMRYRDITVHYTSPATLRDTSENILGFTAVIFQHECDHLDGVLYTDRLNGILLER